MNAHIKCAKCQHDQNYNLVMGENLFATVECPECKAFGYWLILSIYISVTNHDYGSFK